MFTLSPLLSERERETEVRDEADEQLLPNTVNTEHDKNSLLTSTWYVKTDQYGPIFLLSYQAPFTF